MKVQLDITPEQLQSLRAAFAPTPAEIEAIALALVARMKAEQMHASASLTVAEFAKQARITVGYVHQLIREGKIEATNPGGAGRKGDRRITAAAAAAYFAGGSNGDAG